MNIMNNYKSTNQTRVARQNLFKELAIIYFFVSSHFVPDEKKHLIKEGFVNIQSHYSFFRNKSVFMKYRKWSC